MTGMNPRPGIRGTPFLPRAASDLLLGLALSCVVALAPTQLAAQAPPSTDIWLAPLTVTPQGVRIGEARNITSREGYDNQPSFTPDGRAVLYTAAVDGQTDIFRYDVASGQTTRVTNTPESEYSPTVMPGGARFSVIRVEADSTQRLWSFEMDGSDPRLVLERVKPVGYHAWLDASTLALFVLGEPATLQLATLPETTPKVVARDIGRALVTAPGGSGVGFTQGARGAPLRVMIADPTGSAIANSRLLPRGADYFVWLPDRSLLSIGENRLQHCALYAQRDPCWTTVAELAPLGAREGSRLAISADAKWIAFVGVPGGIPVTKEP